MSRRAKKKIVVINDDREKVLEQLNILNNKSNCEKIMKGIQEEFNGGSIDEFIRKFVDEVIISKIDDDRYNIKMDIYLKLLGEEKARAKGARHIDGPTDNDSLYLKNQNIDSVENLRNHRQTNKFTYNVYVETVYVNLLVFWYNISDKKRR